MARLCGSLGWLVCGALLALVLVGAGVIALRSRPPAPHHSPYEGKATLAQLQQLPEANLLYPGSDILSRLGHEDGGLFAGRNPSYAGFGLGTQAPLGDVRAFYAEQLPALGWTPLAGGYSGRSTDELEARFWRKGDRIFRLAFREKESPLVGNGLVHSRYATLYDVKVRGLTSDGR